MQLSRHRFPRHVRLERRDERKNRLRHWTNGRTPHPREPPRWEVAVDPSAEGRSRRSGERRPVRLRRGLFPLRAQHGRAHRLAAFRAAKWNTRATRDASARVPRFVSEAGRLLKPEGTQNKVPLGHLRELSKHRSIRRPFSSESWSDRRDEAQYLPTRLVQRWSIGAKTPYLPLVFHRRLQRGGPIVIQFAVEDDVAAIEAYCR